MTDMPIPSDDVLRRGASASTTQMEGMGPLLQDPKHSSIRIVLNPERMVINESQRLYTYLSLFGFPVDAVIANRVLPEEARSKYFDRWFDIQAGHLATARANFDPLPFFEARLFDREMVGTELLDEFGRRVFGRDRPHGRPLPREAGRGEEGGPRATPSTSGCPSPRRTTSRSSPTATSWSSRWTTSAATSCCRARWPGGGRWAPPSRTSACGWRSGEGGVVSREKRGPSARRRPAAWSPRSSRRPGSTASRRARSAARCSRASSSCASGSSSAWSRTAGRAARRAAARKVEVE